MSDRTLIPATIFVLSAALFIAVWMTAPPPRITTPTKSSAVVLPRPQTSAASRSLRQSMSMVSSVTPVTAAPLRGFNSAGLVALTYDDGPHPVYTPQLLNVLNARQIKATFFVNGIWLEQGRQSSTKLRDILADAVDQGHSLGNHTYSHMPLYEMFPEEQTWEITVNDILLTEIIGRRPLFFRPPFGGMTTHADSIVRQHGYLDIRWNAGAEQTEHDSAATVAQQAYIALKNHRGGIVLMHDRYARVVDATKQLIELVDDHNCHANKGAIILTIVPLKLLVEAVQHPNIAAPQVVRLRQNNRQQLDHRCDNTKRSPS